MKENIASFSPHTSDLSTRGPKYSSGPCANWDVEPEFTDLGLSLVALSIEEPRSGISLSCTKTMKMRMTISLSSYFTFISMLVCSLFIV